MEPGRHGTNGGWGHGTLAPKERGSVSLAAACLANAWRAACLANASQRHAARTRGVRSRSADGVVELAAGAELADAGAHEEGAGRLPGPRGQRGLLHRHGREGREEAQTWCQKPNELH